MSNIFFETLGCSKNEVDSSYLETEFNKIGIPKTDSIDDADFVLVNTCGFIEDAVTENIEKILEYIELKKAYGFSLIVAGCLYERYKKELRKELKGVDFFLGFNDYNNLKKIFQQKTSNKNSKKMCPLKHSFAYVKISEGCDNKCSYCTIPKIRGPYVEYSLDQIMSQTKMRVKEGASEIILIAQDVSKHSKLPLIIKEISKLRSVKWIRLMYMYENQITDELIQEIKANKKVVKYLDIPLQHCSDKILKLMNRKSTKNGIKRTIEKLRNEIENIVIRTTFIVGFPSETKSDFNELLKFNEEMKFERVGVFKYSKEEGTSAAKMSRQVGKETKNARAETLFLNSLNNYEFLENKIVPAIIDKVDDKTIAVRTYADAPDVDLTLTIKRVRNNGSLKIGQIINVKITTDKNGIESAKIV